MQKYVCVQDRTRKSLNFDLTHLKPKIKHTNLVSISKTEKYTAWECIGFSSSKGESAFEQAELLHEHLLPPLLHGIMPGWWGGFTLHCERRMGSYTQMFPSCNQNHIFMDGAILETPKEVTRFIARFESAGGWPSVCMCCSGNGASLVWCP